MFRNFSIQPDTTDLHHESHRPFVTLLYIISAVLIASLLVYAIFHTDKPLFSVDAIVHASIHESGMDNPVTAVLMNFRSYDTLLELVVLVLVATALCPSRIILIHNTVYPDNATALLSQWLIPIIIVFSGYLLWTGAYHPGGAFQAGSLLAVAGIMLLLLDILKPSLSIDSIRWLLIIAVALFVIIGWLTLWFTGTVLQYPLPYAYAWIVLIELAATVSIAMAFVTCYLSLTIN